MIELSKADILAVYYDRAYRDNKWRPEKFMGCFVIALFGTLLIDYFAVIWAALPLMAFGAWALIQYYRVSTKEYANCRRMAEMAYQNATLKWADD